MERASLRVLDRPVAAVVAPVLATTSLTQATREVQDTFAVEESA
jgi:hypothetical protein